MRWRGAGEDRCRFRDPVAVKSSKIPLSQMAFEVDSDRKNSLYAFSMSNNILAAFSWLAIRRVNSLDETVPL